LGIDYYNRALMMYLGTVLVKQQFIINSQRQQLKQIQENIEQEKELNEKLLRQKEEIASKDIVRKLPGRVSEWLKTEKGFLWM